jgi:MFS transporter, PHS family, inorganic phosphate transporter
MIILACAGSLPGYWTAVFTIDTVGRKPLQIGGFALLTILFCILGFMLHRLNQTALLALYVVGQFLFNFGPNTTTFIVPGECFPTRYRSTGHGISAAMGKIGAILAQVISIPLLAKDSPADCHGNACSPWLDRLLQMFALFMLLGTFTSLLIPETKGVTLEELAGEAPTSYNAGRNGSIGALPRRIWNPFSGGQPAGFFYPRAHAKGAFNKGRSPRVGIMTSPEMLSQNAKQNSKQNGKTKRKFWKASRGQKLRSDGSNGYAMSSRSESTAANDRGNAANTNGETDSGIPLPPPAGVLPGWGAGWGRIDRGTPNRTMDSLRLQDVGSLLR